MSEVFKSFFGKRSNASLTPPEGAKREKMRHSTSTIEGSTDTPVDTCTSEVGQGHTTDNEALAEPTAVLGPETSIGEKEKKTRQRRRREKGDADRSSFYRDSITELNQMADKEGLPVSPILATNTGLGSSNSDDPDDYDGISSAADDDTGEGPPMEAMEIVAQMMEDDNQSDEHSEGKIKDILGIENENQGATGGQLMQMTKFLSDLHKNTNKMIVQNHKKQCDMVKKCEESNQELKKEVHNFKIELAKKDATINQLTDRLEKLETYSRYPNIVISGIPEAKVEYDADGKPIPENLSQWFYNEFLQTLGLRKHNPDTDTYTPMCHYDIIHRLGPRPQRSSTPTPRQPRKILIRMRSHNDKHIIWRAKDKLKRPVFMEHHYSPEVEAKRKPLYPIVAIAKYKKKLATVIDTQLLIDGVRYTEDTLHQLPEDLQDARYHCMRSENQVSFLGFKCPLSNFHKLSFKHNGTTYSSSEQWIQVSKARLFPGNEQLIKQMMSTHEPLELKRLGYRVKNFNVRIWNDQAFDVLYPGIKAKFFQNEYALNFLDSTDRKLIVEASPNDTLFGVGLSIKDKNILNTTAHKGENIQGKMLMKARTELLYMD